MTDISFDVHQGEIVGVAALEGQGQRELLRMLTGVEPVRSGSIEVEGRALHAATPASALRAGIGFARYDGTSVPPTLAMKPTSPPQRWLIGQ